MIFCKAEILSALFENPVWSRTLYCHSFTPSALVFQEAAATKIQAAFRGFSVRRSRAPRKAGNRAEPDSLGKADVEARNAPDLACTIKTPLTRSETSVETALIGDGKGLVPEAALKQLGPTAPSRLSFYGMVKESFVTDHVEFKEKLGDGNFADVLRCSAKSDGSPYAVKIIDKRNVPGQREKLMIIHEVGG